SSFSFLRYFHRRVLPSFPTRRSADLRSPCPADRGSPVWASPQRRHVPCVLTLLCESVREFLPRSFEAYQERATVRLTVRTPTRRRQGSRAGRDVRRMVPAGVCDGPRHELSSLSPCPRLRAP